MAAHELRTPVTVLRTCTQLLAREVAKPGDLDRRELQAEVEALDRQTNKLVRLLSQLLKMGSFESGKFILDRQMTNVVRIVHEVVADYALTPEQPHLYVAAAQIADALVDALRLEEVLRNLLDNAIKFSPQGSDIDIQLTADTDVIRLAVRDRGVGVPLERRSQIFERYQQGHSDSRRSGLGLGLYICRQIIEAHGGWIEAEFPVDGGSRFVVTLPTSTFETGAFVLRPEPARRQG